MHGGCAGCAKQNNEHNRLAGVLCHKNRGRGRLQGAVAVKYIHQHAEVGLSYLFFFLFFFFLFFFFFGGHSKMEQTRASAWVYLLLPGRVVRKVGDDACGGRVLGS